MSTKPGATRLRCFLFPSYTAAMAIELIPIRKDGSIDGVRANEHEYLRDVLPECVANYERTGYQEPWIAYVATNDGVIVGTCAFKTPPADAHVEIAYYTFPPYENHGYATQMAQCLVQIAEDTDDSIRVIARTLPIEGPSSSVLQKNHFVKTGEVLHPEDGLVWEWEYRKPQL